MRLDLDEEPGFEEIRSQAFEMFGFNYFETLMNPGMDSKRVDMENVAERTLIRRRLAAKQKEFV